jgi:biotin operon repressor
MTEPAPEQVPEIGRDAPERLARAFMPACAGLATTAEVMHLTGWPGPTGVAFATLGIAGLTYASRIQAWNHQRNGRTHARHVLAGMSAAGGWLTTASAAGPLGGPDHLLAATWAAGTLGGYWWLRRHELVTAARDWREARQDWFTTRREWGLPGSHLLSHEQTRLGEAWEVAVKGASRIVRSGIAERIAESLDPPLPVSRVKVREGRTAGRIRISVRYRDPWAHPVLHPVLDPGAEIVLPVPCSIRDLAVIGQDPETGLPLSLPLCGDSGGRNISVTGMIDSGKTVLLSDLCERVTAADDAMLFRVNLSIKGAAEASMWGPACHLSAFGSAQHQRAARVLQQITRIIEWRAAQPRLSADFVPSRENPLLVLILDEIDALTEDPVLRRLLKHLVSKGREFGLTIVMAGQRGTAEWMGGSDNRTQQNVQVIGQVNRRSEMMHALGDSGLTAPDMSVYGEGRKGVWLIKVAGEPDTNGRAFLLKDPADIRRIVADRAKRQPDLSEELQRYLGDSYRELLETDEFARWAHGVTHPAPPPHAGAGTAVAVAEPITEYLTALDEEIESEMPDDLRRAALGRAAALNAEAARLLSGTGEIPVTSVTREQSAAHALARWNMLAEQTEIPEAVRDRLYLLLSGEGMSGRGLGEKLGVKRAAVMTWLNRLRFEGLITLEGEKRGARWRLVTPQEGDGQ